MRRDDAAGKLWACPYSTPGPLRRGPRSKIDYGASYGSKRYGGWAPLKYLDNMGALQYAAQYPITSGIFQWNGSAWQPMIKPETPQQLATYMRKS